MVVGAIQLGAMNLCCEVTSQEKGPRVYYPVTICRLIAPSSGTHMGGHILFMTMNLKELSFVMQKTWLFWEVHYI